MTKVSIMIMIVFLAIDIILYYPATYMKENQLNFEVFKEEQMNAHIELYDLNTILLFDESIWCLNVSKNCVMVFSKEGGFKKIFYLPGTKEKGSSQMYVYHNQLCIRDKHNGLYQFKSVDEYKKIFLENNKEVQILDKLGNVTDKIKLDEEYSEIMLFLEGQCYLSKKENDEITVYKRTGQKQKEIIDYEKLTNSQGKRQDSSEGVIYRIGGINNKIIKVEEGKELILGKCGITELLFLSDNVHLVMIFLLIIVQLVRYLLWRVSVKV